MSYLKIYLSKNNHNTYYMLGIVCSTNVIHSKSFKFQNNTMGYVVFLLFSLYQVVCPML